VKGAVELVHGRAIAIEIEDREFNVIYFRDSESTSVVAGMWLVVRRRKACHLVLELAVSGQVFTRCMC
jgi:hypothetical protein